MASGSARWQRLRCVEPRLPGASSGVVVRHRSPGTLSRKAHRGWKWQPDGGFRRLGGLPGIGISLALVSPVTSGTLESSPHVYGISGWVRISEVLPYSTARPPYI